MATAMVFRMVGGVRWGASIPLRPDRPPACPAMQADSGDVGEWTSTMWPLYSGRRPVRWAKEMAMAGLSMERLCVWSVWGGRRGGVRH